MSAHIDYLRLGTWDSSAYCAVADKINQHFLTKPGHWLQYHGRRAKDGTAFHGTGNQGGKIHHVCHISGDDAEQWAHHLKLAVSGDTLYCTRIDVQTTIKHPKNYDPLVFYELAKRKSRSVILNPETSTVYLGARSSDLFMRMYEKIVLDKMYLRLEFELKGAYSRNWWSHWRSAPEEIDMLFTSCVNRMRIPEPYASWFNPDGDKTDILNAEKLKADLAQRLDYLRNTETAMLRYLHDHSTQEYVIAFAERLAASIKKLDEGKRND